MLVPHFQNYVPHVPHFVVQIFDFGLWLLIFYLGELGLFWDRFPSKLEHVGFKGFRGVLKILIKNFDSKSDSWPKADLHTKFQFNLIIFRIF